MLDDRGTLREIAWRELFPWLILFRTVRSALDPRKLLLAALALVITAVGWWSLGNLFSGSADRRLHEAMESRTLWPWDPPGTDSKIAVFSIEFPSGPEVVSGNPVFYVWQVLIEPFWRLFDVELTLAGFTYFLLCALWATAVWALAASAITRIAAVELALEERVGLNRAISFARGHWVSCFWAPIFPLLGVLLAVAFMSLGGWLLRFDSTLLLIAIIWPLYLVAGLVMALLLVGLAFGWPLMWPAISSEGTDLFDGISRSYSYVFQRPLHYVFYVIVAALFGVLAWLLVSFVGAAVIQLSFWGASFTGGAERTSEIMAVATGVDRSEPFSALGDAGVGLLKFWVACVRVLTLGFAFSYFWVSSTAIYLLLRRAADAKEMDEVYTDDTGEAHTLPALGRDAAGVPVVPPLEGAESNGEGLDPLDKPPASDYGQ